MPKLLPVGVFNEVEPRPVNVIISALPPPPRNVTELVPLPAQPAQVKTPDVEKVTGSAFAFDVARVTTARSSAPITAAFVKPTMFILLWKPPWGLRIDPHRELLIKCTHVMCRSIYDREASAGIGRSYFYCWLSNGVAGQETGEWIEA